MMIKTPHRFTLTFLQILMFCSFVNFSKAQNSTLPLLTITNLSKKWKNISIPLLRKPVLYSEKGGDLFIGCNAPYPIEWEFSGYLFPEEIVKMRPPVIDIARNFFEIKVLLFFLDGRRLTGFGASVRISCVKLGSIKIREDLYVFVLGDNKSTLVSPTSSSIVDSTILPCLSKDPTSVPILKVGTANGSLELVRNPNMTYYPTEGFYSPTVFNGEYFCEQNSSIKRFQARSTLLEFSNPKFEFYPKTNGVIRVYADHSITFHCFSRSHQTLKMILDDENHFSLAQQSSRSNNKTVEISTKPSTKFSKVGEIAGKIICVVVSSSDDILVGNEVVKEWSFEFVRPPELVLYNFRGAAFCLSQSNEKRIQTVRCQNTMHCKYMSKCLQNPTNCNFQDQKQFYLDQSIRCWVSQLNSGRDCAIVPYFHLNGLVQCSLPGNLTRSWEFFVSLEFLRYSNWKDASENELIRMDEVSPVLYTNSTNTFFCMAVAYLFADSLSFEIEYADMTRFLLSHNGDTVNISIPGEGHPRKIDEFNVIAILAIKLNINVTRIHCLAPWWNDSSVLRTFREFETKYLLGPTFLDSNGLINHSIPEDVVFYEGKENQRLACHARGEPQPEYKWYFISESTQLALDVFTDLKTTSGSEGENYLDFPILSYDEQRFPGEYKCVASNTVGSVERTFKLKILPNTVSNWVVAYTVTVLVIVTILVLVLAILCIYMRRFNKARALVRNLTDAEVEEFFSGNPELLSDTPTNRTNVDVVEFLPYKVEYEIAYTDLEFDLSKSNILGSGHFSFVVRGKIVSTNKPVAIKISKTSADVTLFKTLLSEIKIMAYIGAHENILELIGVCTESIKQRSIYIATDICELGSLNVYLRNARPLFINLMSEEHEIDFESLSAEENLEARVSTLDLLNFSYQIAKGMEYLSSMSVIHADLAARNVLLTADKTVKISDFGLSKKLYQDNNYVKKSKRWMALESLNTLTFSTSSDVWAFGATLYEIFTLGDIPFPNEEWSVEFVNRLANGMRMGRPNYSTPIIYAMMSACWEEEPKGRPNFTQMRLFFKKTLDEYQNMRQIAKKGFSDGKAIENYESLGHTSSCCGEPSTSYENTNDKDNLYLNVF